MNETNGIQAYVGQMEHFIHKNKIQTIFNTNNEEVEVGSAEIASCLKVKQFVNDRVLKYVAFLKFSTDLRVQDLFKRVPMPIIVTIRYNNSTNLLTCIGYLGRASPTYSVKKKYEDILQNSYLLDQIDETAEICVQKGALTLQDKTIMSVVVVMAERYKQQEIKQVLVKQNEDLISQGVYFVPFGGYSDAKVVSYRQRMEQMQKGLNDDQMVQKTY